MRVHNAVKIILLSALIAASGASCAGSKREFPGFLYLLADSSLIEVSKDGENILRTGVRTAAVSPDGGLLLVSEESATLLVNASTGEAKTISDRPARRLGWNPDGSRFFVVSAPETNQIEVGDRLGNMKVLYRGPHRPTNAEGEEPKTLYGEISGCLFLDAATFLFSAYEGVISPSRTDQDLTANKGFLIDLAAPEAEIRSTKFPVEERWKFVAVDPQTGSLLAVVEKKPTGQLQAFLCAPFREWEDVSFTTPIPGTIFQCANGAFSVGFDPTGGQPCALTVIPDARGRNRAVFTSYDLDTQEVRAGADAGWGDNIMGPALYPDGGFAAALVYQWGKEWRLALFDLTAGTSRTAWTRPDRKESAANPNDAVLIWMR
jgi:hypothetical protein